MAFDTDIKLRNQMIYQVFPRQYSKEGNLKGVTKDLDRIKSLGTSILYLLPIHPIGQKNKKGSLGCPYSIKDYRLVDPNIGTLLDLKELIEEVHKRDMKIIIDVVYNHTSRDSFLLNEHPNWFYKNEKNEFANRVGDWWDVTDLDYSSTKDLWNELIDTLCYWAKMGIDGFRCDVAPLIPREFWTLARKALKEINPNVLLLAESIDPGFVKYIRDCGYDAMSDSETYEVFDMEYEYDIREQKEGYVKKGAPLNDWLRANLVQETTYPKNYVKARYLDNHDVERAAKYIKDEIKLRNLTAMVFMLKGIAFIYAGFEACDPKIPSLFDYDYVDWTDYNKFGLADLITKLSQIKKDPLFATGIYNIILEECEVAHITYEDNNEMIEIILNLGSCKNSINTKAKNGKYTNLITDEVLEVKDGMIQLIADPVVIKFNK